MPPYPVFMRSNCLPKYLEEWVFPRKIRDNFGNEEILIWEGARRIDFPSRTRAFYFDIRSQYPILGFFRLSLPPFTCIYDDDRIFLYVCNRDGLLSPFRFFNTNIAGEVCFRNSRPDGISMIEYFWHSSISEQLLWRPIKFGDVTVHDFHDWMMATKENPRLGESFDPDIY